jgi:hypothetical protein
MTVYRSYVSTSLTGKGLTYWIDEGDEQLVGDRTYVRRGNLLTDDRDSWHETKTAAMDEAAVRIETIAAALVSQATQIRREAELLRGPAEVGA